jgi:undecaprenyl-diphosphatase
MRFEPIPHFDEPLLLALREPGDPTDPVGPHWVERMVVDITSLGGHAVLLIVVGLVFGYLQLARKPAAARLALAASLGGMLLSDLLKRLVARPRPETDWHLVEVATHSFPSGHALLSATVYLSLGALLASQQPSPRLRRYCLGAAGGLAFLVGSSRVYLGVHWPSDVIAGWLLGAAWAWGCFALARRLQRAGAVES